MSDERWKEITASDGYTEYGYRGLDEVKKWSDLATKYKSRINELEKELKELKDEREAMVR